MKSVGRASTSAHAHRWNHSFQEIVLFPDHLQCWRGVWEWDYLGSYYGCDSRSSSTACCCLWAAWSLPETTCRMLYFCMVGNFHCPHTKQTNRISIPGLLEIHEFCLCLFHLADRCSICWSRSLWVPWTVAVHKLLAEDATGSACGSQERMQTDAPSIEGASVAVRRECRQMLHPLKVLVWQSEVRECLLTEPECDMDR